MTFENIERNIDTDKVINIANALFNKLDDVLDSELFPNEFTPAELAIGSYLMAEHVSKVMGLPPVPSEIHLGEFVRSYNEFLKLLIEEGESHGTPS